MTRPLRVAITPTRLVAFLLALSPIPGLADTTGGIRGVVRDLWSGQVADVPIQVYSAASGLIRAKTRNGFFSFLGLPPGRYSVYSAGDWGSSSSVLCVEAGEQSATSLFIWTSGSVDGLRPRRDPSPDPENTFGRASFDADC